MFKRLLVIVGIAFLLTIPAHADSRKDCLQTDADTAIKGCTKLIQQGRDTPQNLAISYRNRGIAHLTKREYDLALTDLSKAINLDPKLALAYYARGLAWSFKQQYNRAIANFDKAAELELKLPSVGAPYYDRGNAHANLGKYDLALSDYDRAIKLNPKFADAYHQRGFAQFAKGEYDKALADFNKAIELDPKLAGAYHGRANVYSLKGRIDHAIADYTQAIKLNPELAAAHYYRAIADHDKAIQLDPKLAKQFGTLFSDPSLETHYGTFSAFTSKSEGLYPFSISASVLNAMCAMGFSQKGEEAQQAKGYCIGFIFAVLTELEREGKACFPAKVDSVFEKSSQILRGVGTDIAPFSWDVLQLGLSEAFSCNRERDVNAPPPARESWEIREARRPKDDCFVGLCQ